MGVETMVGVADGDNDGDGLGRGGGLLFVHAAADKHPASRHATNRLMASQPTGEALFSGQA